MEAFAAVFKDIYTTFLLRDFAGKVVPGIVLLTTFATLYVKPSRIVKFLSGELSTPLVFFVSGLAWILVLGLQGLTNYLHLWRYYPEYYHGAPLTEMEAQIVVQKFLQIACQADRQQYERLVVIKEATGNLFAVSIISLCLGGISFIANHLGRDIVTGDRRDIKNVLRYSAAISTLLIFFTGLKLMNSEHISKQYDFAASFVNAPHQGCPADEKADKTKS